MLFSLVEKTEKRFFPERVWKQDQGRFSEQKAKWILQGDGQRS